MKIIIDSREQKALEFTVPAVRGCLPVGDYRGIWSDGTPSAVVFERKSLNDLFGTLSGGYLRFKREMEKARSLQINLIIIVEASLRRVLHGCSHSKRNGLSIVYQLFTIRVRYGIETVFTNTPDEAAQYITHYFLAEERNRQDEIHNQKRTEANCSGD